MSPLKHIRNVLVTEGHYSHTVGITRYLGRKGLKVWAVSPKDKTLVSYSRYCKRCFHSPSPSSEKKYISFIKEVIKKHDIDILIPIGYKSCYDAAKYQKEIRKLAALEVPSFKSIEVALNKRKTYDLAQQIGVPCPTVVYPGEIDEVEYLAEKLGYPLIIKGLYEAGENVVSIVEDKRDLHAKYVEMCEQHGFKNGSLPMLQEYIPGENTDFLTINLLYQRGKCKRIFLQRRIRNRTKLGTATCCDTNIDLSIAQQMKNNAEKMLNTLNWHGVACIEFKRDARNDIVKLIEINPKFWTSIEMSLIAGVNFPYYLCEMADRQELSYSQEYNHKLKFHYALTTDLLALRHKPKLTLDYILDILNPRVKSNIMLSDLKPNLIQFFPTLRRCSRFAIKLLKVCLKRSK